MAEARTWFKHRAWIPIAWLLSLGNIGSVWFAALPGETWHATAHAFLAVLFGVGAERLAARRRARPRSGDLSVGDERMQRLESAIDAIAVEVERIGEGQRFVTKLLAEPGQELERQSQSPRPEPVGIPRTRPNENR
jgi:hypothetical protein